jgi:hypothetical protein
MSSGNVVRRAAKSTRRIFQSFLFPDLERDKLFDGGSKMPRRDLNSIEQVFAKLKHLLRKAAARTVEAVWDAIGQLLPAFIPKECANYFENAAYAST